MSVGSSSRRPLPSIFVAETPSHSSNARFEYVMMKSRLK